MTFWEGKRVLVTGGTGFLGRNLVPALERAGAQVTFPDDSVDLTHEDQAEALFASSRPQVVVHLAADVGGMAYLRAHAADIYRNNVLMNTLVMEHARRANVERFVGISTVNCYPGDAAVPFREEDIWGGLPDEQVVGYGMAKRMLLLQARLYHEQYDFPAVNLVLESLYGPHDVFDPAKARVIPANIVRCIEAREKGAARITAWGTGAARRDYLYVEDAVRAIIVLSERLTDPSPVNVGTGRPVTVKELITLIAGLTGYTGEIVWDASKPDGQLERYFDVSKAREHGFTASVGIEEGLRRTIEWYRGTRR